MINANELRIGNYVNIPSRNINGILYKVLGIWDVPFKEDEYLSKVVQPKCIIPIIDIKLFDPITLTEEILLKCGFVKDVCYYKLKRNSYPKSFNISITGSLNIIRYNLCGGNSVSIKHLHQLQNLYFALTGEELNVEL